MASSQPQDPCARSAISGSGVEVAAGARVAVGRGVVLGIAVAVAVRVGRAVAVGSVLADLVQDEAARIAATRTGTSRKTLRFTRTSFGLLALVEFSLAYQRLGQNGSDLNCQDHINPIANFLPIVFLMCNKTYPVALTGKLIKSIVPIVYPMTNILFILNPIICCKYI